MTAVVYARKVSAAPAAEPAAAAAPSLALTVAPRWREAERRHHDRVDALLAGRRERAARGEKHPVEDFLFTYYSLRPARLRRWHPGAGVVLPGAEHGERAGWRDHHVVRSPAAGTPPDGTLPDGVPAAGVTLDVAAWLARRGDALRHVRDLLAATAARPLHLSCFGLHEWAMVYRLPADDVRHAGWPLRLGAAGTDDVVESLRIRCTHHDAFRFFTPAARPLNAVQPRREDQLALEQPGCLHATMDLYKWAYKLLPAIPSPLVVDAFELARDVRLLDMRASPYDLRALGHEPVPIETAEGRATYVEQQREFATRGARLRATLLAQCEVLLGGPPPR